MDPRERFVLTSYTDLLREGYDPETAQEFLTSGVGMAPNLVERAVELYSDLAKGVREMLVLSNRTCELAGLAVTLPRTRKETFRFGGSQQT